MKVVKSAIILKPCTMRVLCAAVLFVCISLISANIKKFDHYVCKSYLDYYISKAVNPRCFYNPDVGDPAVRENENKNCISNSIIKRLLLRPASL